jgi:CRP/FNR family transcriptional regulator, cyclic AMP receptor protein
MLELRHRDGVRSLPLLELDPDLGRMLSPDRRTEAANGLIVRTQNLHEGLLDLARLQSISPSHIGLLVIDGVIAQEVLLGDTVSTELLGSGDVIRPWTVEEPVELLETEVRWTVLSEVTAALLDRRVAIELCSYPEIYSGIVDRLSQRSARLATTKAISQMTRVDRRLIALFWHLAERWGRMTAQGLRIPLRLSHRLLGQLVGARRPTVSSALAELVRAGELVRPPDSTWLLPGDPVVLPATRAERLIGPPLTLLASPDTMAGCDGPSGCRCAVGAGTGALASARGAAGPAEPPR